MKIIKASAGSGKTYTLSHEYIKWLLESGDIHAYRHLLAVTFTNKATAEMKARILKDLAAKAETDRHARRCLVTLLHDYGSFGVSTIDRFFQQTLRAFCRELGQHSSYQVELDKDALVKEAMDRVLDGVSVEKKDLVAWLRGNAMEQIRRKGRFHLDDGLLDMGKRLKSEEYRQIRKQYGIDESMAFSKERLGRIHELCGKIIKDFEAEAASFGIRPEKTGAIKYPGVRKLMQDPGISRLFENKYPVYNTARIIDGQLYGLGVAREFNSEFEALLKEKNVLPLDESNTLLRDIIDGSDAPFVYEKTGTRYSHYLLDEFQDTSRLQWENFLPLLRDADAAGENLIVGDVKQSIYRWRNSDWQLLGSKVGEAFPDARVSNLDFNWRSAREIVRFNSGFFKFAAAEVGCSDLYSNVGQEPATDEPQPGHVRVSFTDDQTEAVLESIRTYMQAGALPGDIAILVRNKKDGARLAKALIAEKLDVISDDTLDLKGAATVRRLVSLLKYYDNPSDSAGSFIALSLGMEFPDNYHSLIDLCEHLLRGLRDYDPAGFAAETLFTGAFMDMLRDWTQSNGNNLKAFLAEWDKKADCYIGSPENSSAIRIMTIHKSKGLEFPIVIFPYADNVDLFSPKEIRWCYLDAKGTPLEGVADGIYPVALNSSVEHSLFEEAYRLEYAMQTVDNLNIFYVALTRASKSLHVIANPIAKGKLEALGKGKAIKWSNYSELLYKYCDCFDESNSGTPYDFNKMKRKAAGDFVKFPSEYPSIALGGRLEASADASDFFGPDGTTGPDASVRLRGIQLHGILASVSRPEELPAGMDQEGRSLLSERMQAHPEWFPGAGARNEQTVFASDGARYRPDRIVSLPGGGTAIIDYKFGAERASYLSQVRRYVSLYREMGVRDVHGYVWYVPEDKIVEV